MFGLSYSNYLVLNRSLLQSMPVKWQKHFVACLEEFEAATWNTDTAPSFQVQACNLEGQYIIDPVLHYDRGRTVIELLEISE